ncbi:MAG: hypothetical protein M3N08_05300 [Pseudomonadota bacterium]|nr:hypothetical protein [Pseudomonadota bacterium]
MKFALNPETQRPTSPESHHVWKKFHDNRNAICGACGAEAFDHAVGSMKIMAHFNHEADSGPCRLKGAPTVSDNSDYSGDGEQLRSEFFHPDYIQLAFSACQGMVCGDLRGDRFVPGNFTVSRFKDTLRAADTRHAWSLKGLTPMLMPFELITGEVFNIKYGIPPTNEAIFTFVLDKHPLLVEPRERFDRNITVDSTKPIHLGKYFLNRDTTLGNQVDAELDSRNQYLVSEENALELAKPKWDRLQPHHIQCILQEFKK